MMQFAPQIWLKVMSKVIAVSCFALQSDLLHGQNPSSSVNSSAEDSRREVRELSFDDFEWNAPSDAKPLAGSVPLGSQIPVDDSIQIFMNRTKVQPNDYLSWTVLGELLLRRAKEQDHHESSNEAEAAFDRALAINASHIAARLGRAKSLMNQHRFQDAIQDIQPLADGQSKRPAFLAIMADCNLELGRYEQAKLWLVKLHEQEDSPPVLARLARLDELEGRPDKAILLLKRGLANLKDLGAHVDEMVWYHWRLASLLFDSGDLEESLLNVQSALAGDPDDEASKIVLAKIHFAKQEHQKAMSVFEEVLQRQQAPPTLALMGDLCKAMGDEAQAKQWWSKAELAMREEAVVAKLAHAREFALFMVDHDTHLQEALELIRLDAAGRNDVFGQDAIAWVLYKNNQVDEAKQAIQSALSLGVQDPSILYHAAKIYLASGDRESARDLLQRVIHTNPRFSIPYASDLQSLDAHLAVIGKP